MAFHRVRLLMRRSSSRLPGYAGSSSGGIVFTYGVLMADGSLIPASRRRFDNLHTTCAACSVPWFFSTYSRRNSSESSQRWSSPPFLFAAETAGVSSRPVDGALCCCSFASAFTMLPNHQLNSSPFPPKSKCHEILRPNPAHSARESRGRRGAPRLVRGRAGRRNPPLLGASPTLRRTRLF